MPRRNAPTPPAGARPPGRLLLALAAVMAALLAPAGVAAASPRSPAPAAPGDIEDETFADRPVAKVTVKGLNRVTEQEIRNNLRMGAGQPFEAKAVRDDVATLYRLGHFETVAASATLLPDGTVEVVYDLTEQALVRDILTVGNKALTDQDILAAIPLVPGGPRDDFLLEQSIFRIKELYKARGHYLVEVSPDERRLKDSGILIFKIIEGPRVRIRKIDFVGNLSFPDKQLSAQIKTKQWFFLFQKGNLDEQQLIDDVAELDRFYKDRGFVDVRVDRRIELSPDQVEAKVVFVVTEGRRYRLRSIRIEGAGGPGSLSVYSPEQLQSLMVIRPGDFYQQALIEKSMKSLETAFKVMGYIDARVNQTYYRVGESPEVDMLISVEEGEAYDAGLVKIQGNFLTRDKVVRRLVRMQPGRPIDGREIDFSEIRLKASGLFNESRITPQAPEPDEPTTRDLLVEVKERNTGSLNFGVSIGSDTSLAGEVSLSQSNFDLYDYPLTPGELIAGRAFRGAGQTFNITIAPGIEVSNYSVSLGEPHLFESDYGGAATAFYRNREYNTGFYNEERYGTTLTLARVLGDVWKGSVSGRFENVKLTDFSPYTPIEVYDDRGPAYLSSVSAGISRNTVDSLTRPGRGSIIDLSATYYGAFGGAYNYPAFRANYSTWFTLDEDFLGRKTTLRLNSSAGWILSSTAPTYERFYLGGRSFRGFEFRTISPTSQGYIIAPDFPNPTPVGGQFLFFAGAQYEMPLIQEFITGVAFVDSGTVDNDFSLDQYRVSIGFGVRLYIAALGPAPIAFDFAWPLAKEPTDVPQVFSFNAELPF